jgi:cell division protein FtsB
LKNILTKNEKVIIYISIALAFFLIYLIVFSNNGILDYLALKKKQAAIAQKIEHVTAENQVLKNEISSLKTDQEYIKHVAKQEHEMAEHDELIFKVPPQSTVEQKKE